MNLLKAALIASSMLWATAAHAASCPRKGTLGTSRILAVDAATTPRVGLKNFPQTLPLRDHEVVLTFDDGPWPPTTPKVEFNARRRRKPSTAKGQRSIYVVVSPDS